MCICCHFVEQKLQLRCTLKCDWLMPFIFMNSLHLVVLLKSNLDVQQTASEYLYVL
jgi:hypothetical protein